LEEMIVMGRMDARRWAKSVGFDVEEAMRDAVGESKMTM
jgi:hypothetical protein